MTKTKSSWLLVGLVCLVFWPAHAPAQGGEWKSYMARGVGAYEQGNYPEAEKQLAAALREAEGFAPQDPRLAQSLNNLALIYEVQGQYAKAEPLYQRSLANLERVLGPWHPNVAKSLNNLAALFYAHEQPTRLRLGHWLNR